MLNAIPTDVTLAGLTTREDDDFAITVLDLWAAVADVLTFYQERYANEAFLRTATRRESVRRLADLIGYQLAPGAAALTWLAFSLENGQALALPAGLRVQSVPGQGTKPPEAAAAAPSPAPASDDRRRDGRDLRPRASTDIRDAPAFSADARLNRLRVFGGPAGPGPARRGSDRGRPRPCRRALDRRRRSTRATGSSIWNDGQATRVEEKQVRAVRLEDDAAIVGWTQPVAGTAWSGLDIGVAVHPDPAAVRPRRPRAGVQPRHRPQQPRRREMVPGDHLVHLPADRGRERLPSRGRACCASTVASRASTPATVCSSPTRQTRARSGRSPSSR